MLKAPQYILTFLFAVLVTLLLLLALSYWIEQARADEIDEILPYLIEAESGGDPHAIGDNGEVGLCQISPITLIEYNNLHGSATFHYEDLFDEVTNRVIATWYLRRLRDHYKCEILEQILTAYNWGIGNLKKANYDINKAPESTKEYIRKIMKAYHKKRGGNICISKVMF